MKVPPVLAGLSQSSWSRVSLPTCIDMHLVHIICAYADQYDALKAMNISFTAAHCVGHIVSLPTS
eukprot:scaffold678575_cov61-Prasinocladus_malaysianus.AAC.1